MLLAFSYNPAPFCFNSVLTLTLHCLIVKPHFEYLNILHLWPHFKTEKLLFMVTKMMCSMLTAIETFVVCINTISLQVRLDWQTRSCDQRWFCISVHSNPNLAPLSPYLNVDPTYIGRGQPEFIFPEGASHRRGRFELAFSQIGGSVMVGASLGGMNGLYKGFRDTSLAGHQGSVRRTQWGPFYSMMHFIFHLNISMFFMHLCLSIP